MKNKELKDLTILDKMKISNKIKEQIKKEGKRWIKFIDEHRGSNPQLEDKSELTGSQDEIDYGHWEYHTGEISFIEFFFGIKHKQNKKKKYKGEK